MEAALVIAHGSRAKETEAVLETVLEMVGKRLPKAVISYAFMEFSDKTVEKAVAELAAKGAKEIKVVPYFLFTGIHLKEDIPQIVGKCAEKYPDIRIKMGETLGADERLAAILADRIEGV